MPKPLSEIHEPVDTRRFEEDDCSAIVEIARRQGHKVSPII
jgi:hypothetical protein